MERSPEVLATFAAHLSAMAPGPGPAHRLCEAARQTLGADAASLAIKLLNGRWNSLWSTGLSTERFDHLQELAGEGPADDVAASGRAIFVQVDQRGLDMWSTLSVVAERDVIRGNYWVVPMRPLEVVVGVLTLHRESGVLAHEQPAVQFIADTVGSALLRETITPTPPLVSGEWTERAEIHQATGMVTAQLKISPEDALALLQAHAFSQNVDLHTLALDVVARKVDFSDSDE